MITIRHFREDTDSRAVGILIADTYSRFNLNFVPAEELGSFLGPFQHARSSDKSHQEAIASVIRAPLVIVAEQDGDILGVLRGRNDKLQSLFVRADVHRQGIGRALVARFEEDCMRQGTAQVRLMATLFAVPFYQAMGYRKTTGIRRMRSFEGEGLPYQPMKKVFGC